MTKDQSGKMTRDEIRKALDSFGENSSKFDDPRAQRLSDLWFSLGQTATEDQKDKIARLFIVKILGLKEEVAERFAKDDRGAWHEVGLKQSNLPVETADYEGFWRGVEVIFHTAFSEKDMVFLLGSKDWAAVCHFLWQLEPSTRACPSSLLHKLSVNAHAYK